MKDKFCIHCGNKLDYNDVICDKCGKKCEPPFGSDNSMADITSPNTVFCESCGNLIGADDAFCFYCGSPTEQAYAQPSEPFQPTEPAQTNEPELSAEPEHFKLHSKSTSKTHSKSNLQPHSKSDSKLNLKSASKTDLKSQEKKPKGRAVLITVVCLAVVALIAVVGVILYPDLLKKGAPSGTSTADEPTVTGSAATEEITEPEPQATEEQTTAEPAEETEATVPTTEPQSDLDEADRVDFDTYTLIVPDYVVYETDDFGVSFFEKTNHMDESTGSNGYLFKIIATDESTDEFAGARVLGEKDGYSYVAVLPTGFGIIQDEDAGNNFIHAKDNVDNILDSFELA